MARHYARTLRVLAIGNMYPPHHLGGYELVWRSSVEHLRRTGHDVRVLTTDFRRAPPDGSLAEDPDVHRELRWYWRDHRFPRRSPVGLVRIERHNAAVLDRHLTEFRPHAITWWSMGGMSMSLIERVRRRRLAALAVVHDDWPLYGPVVDGWSRHLARRRRLAAAAERATGITTCHTLEGIDRCSFNSEFQRQRVAECLPCRGSVEQPGVDLELFRPAPVTSWRGRLVYCGRLDSRKGVDLAVRALALVPNAQLRVVGSGDARYRAELERLAAELGVRDRVVIEQRDRHDLPAVYAAADAVLFPVRWDEPWGLVPLEAMAVGRPVVASARGGSGEYLEDGQNCLVSDPDAGPDALAAAVAELATDQRLRERLREAGLRTAAEHSDARFQSAIEAVLAEVTTRPSSAS